MSCSTISSTREESLGSSPPSKSSSKTTLASPKAESTEKQYTPFTDEEAKQLASRAAGRMSSKSAVHHANLQPDRETIFLSYHPSVPTSSIRRSTIRTDLSKFEHRICAHRCTSDAPFLKSVQRHRGFNIVGVCSPAFFGGKSGSESDCQSRVWHCSARKCGAAAWIEMQSDTGMLTVEIRR